MGDNKPGEGADNDPENAVDPEKARRANEQDKHRKDVLSDTDEDRRKRSGDEPASD